MTANEILDAASFDGVTVHLAGDQLRAAGPAEAVRFWQPFLSDRKQEIIALLKTPPRTADQFTPAERSRWCMAHELTLPDHRCPNRLPGAPIDDCVLWQAVRWRKVLH